MKEFSIKTVAADYRFVPALGPVPAWITVKESDGQRFRASTLRESAFSIKTEDGTIYRPFCTKETPCARYAGDGAEIVEFSRVPWKNASGEILDNLHLSLKWEFHPDGAVFCDLYLFYAALNVPELHDFLLAFPLDLSSFDDVKWSVRLHPEKLDATIIQATPPERFLPSSESRAFPDRLFAQTNFNAMRGKGPSFFAEFLLEGNNSLFNREISDTASSVARTENGFEIVWNFQKRPRKGTTLPLHWRNRIGLLFRPAPVKRNLPPLSICHYIDNFERFPTDAQIRAIANSGADVLMLHDCWRFDTQNGGIPYDEAKFRHGVRLAHRLGLRVVPYVRGNELSVTEDAASWFDTYLTRDFDGLYMDYGGPFGFAKAPDENFPGGRVAFREYYRCMRALRARVGKNGVFYSHTGTGYSGIATGFFDGYVSGEGERGILIRGRREHEYFSMSAVSPGSMWTAAFPEYSSKRMIPFLAAAAQPPHLPVGKQIESSSLRHPPVPGVSDGAFRELLHTWSLLDGGRNGSGFEYYTDFNSRGIFDENDPYETAHCLILAPGGKYGVMTLSNCSGAERSVRASFRLNGAFSKCRLFPLPGGKDPASVKTLAPFEIVSALIAPGGAAAERLFARHPRPSARPSGEAARYLEFLKEQRELREGGAPSPEYSLTIFFPTRVTSHEESLMKDLYDIVLSLRERRSDGSVKRLGYLSKKGLVKNLPPPAERLHPGIRSRPVDLAELLGKGRHVMEVYSEHLGEPFYSFITAEIETDTRRGAIEFMNELEPDRSILHWEAAIK